jgi:hypothetical protein
MSNKVAEKWLEKHDKKLKAGRRRDGTIRDRKAYDQGAEDSKKIDVHRKGTKEPAWQGEVVAR